MEERNKPPALSSSLHETPIAIIGYAAIFPQAENVTRYWDNIMYEVDCITDVPPSRWRIEDYYDPDPTVPDKTYCKRGGFIPEIDFHPMDFGLPPNILEVTDASQLLSLVVAKELMETSGYGQKQDFDRDRVGVVLGVASGQKLITPLTTRLQTPVWERVLKSSGLSDEDTTRIIEKLKLAYVPWNENSFPGLLGNVIAGRIANRLDLGGINCVVDAACASTLAALEMSISYLTEGRGDMVITGGVDTNNSIFIYLCFSKTPALTRGEYPRPFDANTDGMMVGEGIGMVLLKRLADAERDGDRIYAVIRGIGSSSDGRYASIYAPRVEGQIKALRRAYQDANVPPSSIDLLEAHGTGTAVGDPVEIKALMEVFANDTTQHIGIGSVKSQIGHTKASAGAAGLVKASLALYHKVLPATLHVEQPHPGLVTETSPFYVNTKTRPWIRAADQTPRRAGVSAFGFGGTNFHLVLEEYQREHDVAYRLHDTPQMIIFSAADSVQLQACCKAAQDALTGTDAAAQFTALATETRVTPLPQEVARLGFVAANATEAATLLRHAGQMFQRNAEADAWDSPKGVFYRRAGWATAGQLVALFPGQGSQYPDMGRELACNFPPVRTAFGAMDARFLADGLAPLSRLVFPPPAFENATRNAQEAALRRTEHAQPAIGVLSLGMYRLLAQAGFAPDFAAGHSSGELTALWAGGVLDEADYLALIKARGQAMAAPADSDFDAGMMVAVQGDADAIEAAAQALPDVVIANRNSRAQTVLAGATPAMENAQRVLAEQGFTVTPLPVSAAFHTPLVAHASAPFARALDAITFHAPRTPVYANTTGQPYPAKSKAIKTMLANHILNPVMFRQEIEAIYAAGGRIFVEIGPRSVLTYLVKDILGDQPHLALALNPSRRKDSDRQFREAAVQLRVIGVPLSEIDPYQL